MKIAVVGLGVMGRSICRALAARGHRVTGFEQQAEGAPQGSSRGTTRIFRATPGEGEIYIELAARALAGWETLERASGEPILNWTGGVMAGEPDSGFVRSTIALAQEYGHPHRLMSPAEVAAECAGFTIPGGWAACHLPRCAVLAADRASALLLAAAQGAGADCRFGARIDSIAALEADHDRVVIAAGPWANGLATEMAAWLEPVRKTFLELTLAGSPPPLFCTDDADGTYGMPVPGGRFKIGFDSEGIAGADPECPWLPEDPAALEARFRGYFPHADAAVALVDACFYTRTPDLNFLIAPRPGRPETLLVSCCSGHGFKYAPALGEIVADRIEGRANRFADAFAPGPGRVTPGIPVGEE